MFNLTFASGDSREQDEQVLAFQRSSQGGGKRSRRRRHTKSRNKAQVEPMIMSAASLEKKQHDAPMTKSDIYFALDCEMVGVGMDGLSSVVARVTIVNWENVVILDTFVKVNVPVTDYRTHVSGITAQDIESDNAMTYEEVRNAVKDILRGKILIGHGLENDLQALGLTHPWCDVRDTACYAPYMREIADAQTGELVIRPRKLRDLTQQILGRQIQQVGRPHCPIDDAIASLDLYKAARFEWENELSRRQQEKAREAEKQERRFKYNFFWNGNATPGMYHPCEPHNVHLLPIALDPRLAHPYGAMPGYHPAMPVASPPPPPPPPPPQPQAQPVAPTPSSSWFFFRRPKTPPPPTEAHKEDRESSPTTDMVESDRTLESDPTLETEPTMDSSDPTLESEPTMDSSDPTLESEPTVDSSEPTLPDIQYLSLESSSQDHSSDATNSCVVAGGLPFYSKSSIWGQDSM